MKRQDRKKILFVITQGAWGGAQRYVFDLATKLSETYDVTVAIGEIEGKRDLQNKLEVVIGSEAQARRGGWKLKIQELKHLKRRISPLHDILAIYELRGLYKTIQPDIIHLNSSKAGILGSLGKLFVVRCSLFVVYTVHGWITNEPLGLFKKRLYTFLEKITAPLKSAFIVLSPQDRETGLKTIGIKDSMLYTIPLGIDITKKPITNEEARKILSQKTDITLKQDQFIFGSIAGLYKTKGLDILISAVEKKKSDLADAQFLIIGEGPEKTMLEKLIQDKDLENMIHLVGYVENVAELLPAFNTFVLPSRKEGLPYTILEAKHANIPIIATNVGGVPSMIKNNETGLLIEPEHSTELGDSLVKMYRERKRLQPNENNPKHSLDTLENMVQQTEKLYEELLHRN